MMLEARSYRMLNPATRSVTFPRTLLTFGLHKEEGSLWFYAPNKGAPIAFAILFAVSGAIHLYQTMYDYSRHTANKQLFCSET